MKIERLLKSPAVFCAAVLLASMLIIHPSLNMGLGDDFSYVRTAKYLAETGHLDYFGWATPMLGWQLLIAVPLIKLFGFSFNVVRASVFCVALVLTLLLHPLFVRAGLRRRNATFATLAMVLSPIFLPLAYTYMSDVPGFFAIVLCLYCCLRAVESVEDQSAFRWLMFAAVSNVVGGTARQIAWLGVLVMVPSTFWIIRHRRLPVALAVSIWVACVGMIFWISRWFSHQLFSQPEKLISGPVNSGMLHQLIVSLLHFLLGLSLLSLPVFIAFFPGYVVRSRRLVGIVLLVVAAVGLAVVSGLHHHHQALLDWLAPFNRDFLTTRGMIEVPEIGDRPVVLGPVAQVILTLVSVGATLSFLLCLWRMAPARQTPAEDVSVISWHKLLLLLGPFAAAYLGLLLPRGAVELMRDRYVLVLLLVTLIVSIRFYQERVSRELPWVSFAFLFLFAAFGIAGTHDLFAMHRAKVAAADELIEAGVPPASFYGGFEYDGTTQIDQWGYVNAQAGLINVPPGVPYRFGTMAFKPCGYSSAKLFVAIHAKYALSFSPDSCQGASAFPAVTFHTWLPPFSGKIYIQNVTGLPTSNLPTRQDVPIGRP